MIVVDVNIIVYFWIKGEFSELAAKVLQRDAVWAAPLLWRPEFRNCLLGYLRKGMRQEHGRFLLEKAESQMSGNEFLPSSDHVMRLATQSGCSAYDCEYVAVAEDLGVHLVTADAQLLKEFPRRAISLRQAAGMD